MHVTLTSTLYYYKTCDSFGCIGSYELFNKGTKNNLSLYIFEQHAVGQFFGQP